MHPLKFKDKSGKWRNVRYYSADTGLVRTEIIVEAEPWSAPVTIQGSEETLSDRFFTRAQLKEMGNSDPWNNAVYYVTLKDLNGSALESGCFKLSKSIDGYAAPINQVFYLPSLHNGTEKIYENMPVDFHSISDDRKTFLIRDAGLKRVSFETRRPLMKRYEVIFVGRTVCVNTATPSKYFNLSDSFSLAKAAKVRNHVWIGGNYTGINGVLGYLSTWINGCVKEVCVRYTLYRTKKGGAGTYNVICGAANQMRSDTWYQDTSAATDDFTKEPIYGLTFGANANYFYLVNGSSVVLIEE